VEIRNFISEITAFHKKNRFVFSEKVAIDLQIIKPARAKKPAGRLLQRKRKYGKSAPFSNYYRQ